MKRFVALVHPDEVIFIMRKRYRKPILRLMDYIERNIKETYEIDDFYAFAEIGTMYSFIDKEFKYKGKYVDLIAAFCWLLVSGSPIIVTDDTLDLGASIPHFVIVAEKGFDQSFLSDLIDLTIDIQSGTLFKQFRLRKDTLHMILANDRKSIELSSNQISTKVQFPEPFSIDEVSRLVKLLSQTSIDRLEKLPEIIDENDLALALV